MAEREAAERGRLAALAAAEEESGREAATAAAAARAGELARIAKLREEAAAKSVRESKFVGKSQRRLERSHSGGASGSA